MTRSPLLALLFLLTFAVSFADGAPSLKPPAPAAREAAYAPAPAAPSVAAIPWQLTVGSLVNALLIVLVIVGLVLQLRSAERRLVATLRYQDRDAAEREKRQQTDLQHWKTELRKEIESLHAALAQIPADTERLIASKLPKQQQTPAQAASSRLASAVLDVRDERRGEDGLAQLLVAANRIVQESSMTLETFRERMAGVSSRVLPYGQVVADAPVAFIVEHGGSAYAVPNVVKPTRFPNDWFNRADFGVNDEIRRVVSLPRLRRRGDGFDVVERGVFER